MSIGLHGGGLGESGLFLNEKAGERKALCCWPEKP